MGVMHPTYYRMAELWGKSKDQTITKEEYKELSQCMDWHANLVGNLVKLENNSVAAHITNDTKWQHEICEEIDKLKEGLMT